MYFRLIVLLYSAPCHNMAHCGESGAQASPSERIMRIVEHMWWSGYFPRNGKHAITSLSASGSLSSEAARLAKERDNVQFDIRSLSCLFWGGEDALQNREKALLFIERDPILNTSKYVLSYCLASMVACP